MSFLGVVSESARNLKEEFLQLPSVYGRQFSVCDSTDSFQAAFTSDVEYAETSLQKVLFWGRLFESDTVVRKPGIAASNGTATVLEAYLRWGSDFPKHLAGEFVFAVWNSSKRSLTLGRDTTGYRPLFYALHQGELRFASEPRLLLALPGMPCLPDEAHIARWLAVIPTQTDSTFFEGVHRLLPGHTLVFENGQIQVAPFWRPEKTATLHLRDSREYADGLLAVMERAVANRIAVGGLVGTQLSGGLDSSSIAALAAGQLAGQGRNLPAFTSVPKYTSKVEGRFCDETVHASSVAALYPNMDHVLVQTGAHSAFYINDLFATLEQQPSFGPQHLIWLYEISRQARQRKIDTMLTGSAGNMGPSYNGTLSLTSLLLRGQWMKLAGLATDLHRVNGDRWRSLLGQTLFPLLPVRVEQIVEHLRGRQTNADYASLMRPEFARAHGLQSNALEDHFHVTDSRKFRLLHLYRTDLGLTMSALYQATGVWSTDPTLDQQVIEYCMSVPVEQFCEHGVRRSLIRDAMKGRLSEQVRTEVQRGLQAADFLQHLGAEKLQLALELQSAREHDVIARVLDLPQLEDMIGWSDERIRKAGWPSYTAKLMRAISLIRFLRRMAEGTLFDMPEPSSYSLPST